MIFKVDTHSHTLASGHAYNTMREMAEAAAAKGLQALAITEHAPEMPGTVRAVLFSESGCSTKRDVRNPASARSGGQYHGS